MVDHKAMNEGWEERFAKMREEFDVQVPAPVFGRKTDEIGTIRTEYSVFSKDEWTRMEPKLQMVRDMAVKSIWGMIKGTVKYKSDDYTPAQWLDHLFDEQVDGINYQMLFEDSIKRLKQERMIAINNMVGGVSKA